jgi:hypothetical protein
MKTAVKFIDVHIHMVDFFIERRIFRKILKDENIFLGFFSGCSLIVNNYLSHYELIKPFFELKYFIEFFFDFNKLFKMR